MVIPSGKRRFQVNQGGSQHETIWDSDLFKKFSADQINKIALVHADEDKKQFSDPEIDSAMADSSSPKMNLDNLPNSNDDNSDMAPQSAAPSANTQENTNTNSNGNGNNDFGIIATELGNFIRNSDKLGRTYTLVKQDRDQKSSRWTFVIEPAQDGNIGKVTTNGPPFMGTGQQAPGGPVTQTV